MPTPYTERLYIAPADRWNVHRLDEYLSVPGDVCVEYVRNKSYFSITSPGGFAQKVMKHRSTMWSWLLANRRKRFSRSDSESSWSSWEDINDTDAIV